MKHPEEEIRRAHKLSANHRRWIEAAARCGCFYCQRTYSGSDITHWIHGGNTALCPHCGVDSVLPENCGYEITEEFLAEMNRYWFGK